jgi:hypothetical protein
LYRLFSTFPGGGRGLGLLLLRAAVGAAALVQGGAYLAGSSYSATGDFAAGLAATLSGVALLFGFLTPVVGGLVTLGEIGVALSWAPLLPTNPFEATQVTLFVAVVSAAIILLGPGALSLDARLFGRREIIIPRSPQRL